MAAVAPPASALPPGPRIAGPALTLRYTFDQPRLFAECRRRYGAAWTLRLPGFPPIVVTTDRDAIRDLFTGDPLTKRHGNDILRELLGDRSVLLLEPAEHLERRRLELPAFHGDAIRAYRERIAQLAHDEVASWPDGVVATLPRARDLTLAIILELVLGVRDAALRRELARTFDALDTPLNNLGLFLPPALRRRAWWNVPVHALYRKVEHVHDLLGEHVAATRADPGRAGRTDVLSVLLRGGALSDADLRDELMTLVLAGHETTATAIAWACDLLAHHPSVVARLRDELDGGERAYLRATAKEVLRVRTVVYASAARYPLEPMSVAGWTVEPGTGVLVDAQGVHGDPDVHPDPHAFRPERFLDGQADRGYAYLPFGGGAHRCLGASLAMLELELALEAIVGQVDLEPAGPPAKRVRRGVALAPAGGGKVRSRSRTRRPGAARGAGP